VVHWRSASRTFVSSVVTVVIAVGVVAAPRVASDDAGAAQSSEGAMTFDGRLLDSLAFRLIGPNSPSGRVWQVTGVPSEPNTLYICTCQGGVWRTTNYGATITPIFDEENGASCGAVAIAPSNPDHIWVGTGEPAQRQSNALGYGVFKSTDGGQTWQHLGLEKTEQIGAVVIHPQDPNTVYVAALGHLWGRNPERGVYKTTDGGRTWQRVLYVDDMSGAVDLVMDPANPNVLYASTWQRMRSGGAQAREAGPGSRIYKTTDAGATWARLTNGLPAESLSKITLGISRTRPNLIYAFLMSGEGGTPPDASSGPAIEDFAGRPARRTSNAGGMFRSEDGGATWRRVSAKLPSRTYYTKFAVDPSNDQRLWVRDLLLWRSDDGGVTWERHNMRHVHYDLHGLWIDPNDSRRLVLGGDGGVHFSVDEGATWVQAVLPIAQFYEVAVDNLEPYWVYGGMQDTASWTGPSRTYDNEGITDHDWIKVRWVGDGMAIVPDPRDANVIYMAQNNGNTSRLDLRTWARTELQPSQELAKGLGLAPLRWDWSPPLILDVTNPDVLYVGSQYVFRCEILKVSADGYADHRCTAISDDLSRQQDQPFPAVGEGYHSYGALFSLAQSTADPNVLWAGADDGWIHVSRDRGKQWARVDQNIGPGPHSEGFVSKIEPSRAAAGTAYVAYDLHYRDDTRPYLFKTADFGKTWTNITSNLPMWGNTYVIREDPDNPRVLYVGTEGGLFVSINGGGHWIRWKGNLPHTGVRSLAVQARERELAVGTFGRAIWIGDIGPIAQLEEALRQRAFFFDVKPAVAHNIRYTYGSGVEEINGDLFFRAENPPYGTLFTYYLREDVPGEARFTVRDSAGTIVRSLTGRASAGVHRVQWDLETDDAKAMPPTGGGTASERQRRQRVSPGTYSVTLEVGGSTFTRSVEVRGEQPDRPRRVWPR
jgi:photosystem II stability/assembly factor-like uncharacterized protein